MSRIVGLAAALLVAATVAAVAAQGGTISSSDTHSYVTSYVSIDFNSQWCSRENATKYKLVEVDYRWYREVTSRHVTATINYGELGSPCTGFPQSYSHGIYTYNPCWGCGNSTSTHWTPSEVNDGIYYPYNWPYLGNPTGGLPDAEVGAWAKTAVKDSSGNVLSNFCVQADATGGYC